ncbi:patatin-like phospholipase family protein [Paraburkholderia dilworthii]|uniref:patatin-like phospholipase family protein n=1 Tax=Paraburkholderia dilworthii TaxID=948106 RepID=UPI0004859122|nr:patatin-like phospholipase family protein [Paraburkholderia dilworthii]
MTTDEQDLLEPLPQMAQDTARPVFLAFQGGGARGIAHVGGLAAVNDLGLPVAGVAGTSAGAIMAALVAAGYRADQLLDPDAGTHLLQKVAGGRFKQATALFGRNWRYIRWLRQAVATFGCAGRYYRSTPLSDDLAWLCNRTWGKVALILAGLFVAYEIDAQLPRPAFAILIVVLILAAWLAKRCVDGLASLDEVLALVDEAIAEGLKLRGRNITFADLKAHNGLPLKLVATNVSDQSLELFSAETTPDVKVADAVAASICLPVVFRPWSFSFKRRGEPVAVERRFIDGGLVSNLPVWTFDEERALNEKAVTIAFGLNPPKKGRDPHWLPAALQTVVAGPPEVHFRGIDRMIHIPLDSKLSVLAFDARFDDLSKVVAKATSDATTQVQLHLTEVPTQIRRALAALASSVSDALKLEFAGELAGREAESPLFRIALGIQKPSDRLSLTIAYELGHDDSLRGARLALDSPAGLAWQGVTAIRTDEASQIYRDSRWTGCVPVRESHLARQDDGTHGLTAGAGAVVAIFDSPFPLPDSIWADKGALEEFWVALSELVTAYFADRDTGNQLRRSMAWL